MAGKRNTKIVTTTTEETPIASEQVEQPEMLPDPEIQELADFYLSLGSSANLIKIYKLVEGQRAYCGSAEPAAVTEDYILKRWRGGKYFLQALNNGRYVAGGTRQVIIFEPPEDPLTSRVEIQRNDQNNNGEISILKDSLARQQEMIIQLIQANSQKSNSSVGELASALKELSALQPKNADPMAMFAPVLDLVKSTLDFSKEATAGEDPKIGWLKFATQALEKVPMILGAGRPPAPYAENPPGGNDLNAIRTFIVWGISELKKKALKGADPGLYADLILDNLDDPKWAPFVELVNKPFVELAAYDPALNAEPLNSWFKTLFNLVKENLSGAETEFTSGAPGSGADVKGNETLDSGSNSQSNAAPAGPGNN